MPTEDVPSLTPNQILALVVLMSEAHKLNNNELKELAGFSLTGDDNKKLEKLGLIQTDRSHRPFSHELTDKGWHVMRDLHTTEPPKAGKSASRALLTLLGNIHRSLEQLQVTHGVKLSEGEFFRQVRGESVEGAVVSETAGDAEAQVRAAYAELAPAPGEWVGLADLRDKLERLERAEVDRALMALLDRGDVRIIPVANTKALKPRDIAAALRIGGEDNHTLSIGRS
ncbi:hypothetical protein [Dactylosporangium salmoneum]|uniref:MarR family transcriptional regulator n=1 Tax=Dactylosporangium salmoneum TaxID=53361 RepID=A0ABN3HB61_9ACTN